MSRPVTTRTQTARSSFTINTGYLTTWSGVLKLLELALGIVCVGIAGHEFSDARDTPELFFLLMTTNFMIGTFILLLSYLVSFPTASIMSKTIYEPFYHFFAFGLLLTSSLTLMQIKYNNNYDFQHIFAIFIIGLINAGFYFISTVIAFRIYKTS